MSVHWMRLISWHAVLRIYGDEASFTVVPWALCGRRPNAFVKWSETLPEGKTCETCLRILAKRSGE